MALTKPRILYFHHAIGMGGAPRSLAFLIAGLDRDRFEPLVIMPKRPGNGQVRQLLAEAGAEVIEETDIRPFNGSTVAPCRGLKKRGYAVLSYNRTVRAARNWVARLRPNLVHLNSTCLVAAAKGTHQVDPDLPVIAHVREPLLTNAWGRWLARMNRQHVNWFIAIDQFGLDSIGLASPRGNVVYNFVDRQQFHPEPALVAARREALGWLPDQVIFLSLSRVAPANGAWELARLVAKTDSQLPLSARFVFAGFAEPPTDYERKTRSLISTVSRCDSLDFVSDVVPVLDAADVIVAPFTSPHSARSVFEGAAMGMPALVSRQPNLMELIQEGRTGFSFNLDDEAGFVDKVEQLCQPSLRDAMRDACLEHAGRQFDLQTNTQRTVQVYEQLLRSVG